MVKFAINMVGNKELGARINKLIKRIDKETENTLTKMSNETLLFAEMVAPRRTGATALSIKQKVSPKLRVLYMTPLMNQGFAYNVAIDNGNILKANKGNWGTNLNDPRMKDKRKREDKVYFFVGSESVEGKTLAFAKKNFKRHVEDLGHQIAIS
jgi:alanine dehydrogenase